MKAIVVLNCGSGSAHVSSAGDETARVAAAFAAAGLAPTVQAVPARHIQEAASAAARSDADAVVFGGGDGTISAGAAALVGGDKALGILPLGTFNHFARDLGIPLKLEDAVRTIALGHVREVDVGEVNGRPFVNNSSIGLYPEMVRHRDDLRRHHGMRKGPAMLRAAREVLREPPFLRVHLRVFDDVTSVRTPFVFVGNNRYEMNLFALGSRAALDRGDSVVATAESLVALGLLKDSSQKAA
jgi:diacylglycerol kinase family enzyme